MVSLVGSKLCSNTSERSCPANPQIAAADPNADFCVAHRTLGRFGPLACQDLAATETFFGETPQGETDSIQQAMKSICSEEERAVDATLDSRIQPESDPGSRTAEARRQLVTCPPEVPSL